MPSPSTHQQLIELTEDFIRIPSVTKDAASVRACVDRVEEFFQGTSLTVTRFESEGVPSIVVTNGTRTPTVFLCGHLDVVPASDEQFIPRREGDRLYGRGAFDMKSGNAVMMTLMRELGETHDIGLMLTGDEEVGGFHGVSALLQEGFSSKIAIIPDGGYAVHRVVQKEKGIFFLTLRATGIAAHGSVPWKGKNAVNLLMEAILRIQATFPPIATHPEDHWVATCTVGMIQGGTAFNQIPESAFAKCDIRYTEATNPDELLTQLTALLPEGVVLEQSLTAPLVFVDPAHPLVSAFIDVLKEQGCTPEWALDHGSSDGRFFTERGIPVLISQPDGAGHHGPEEWVSMEAIGRYYDVVSAYLDRVAKR